MNAQDTDVKLTLFSEYRNSSFQLVEIRLTKAPRSARPFIRLSWENLEFLR